MYSWLVLINNDKLNLCGCQVYELIFIELFVRAVFVLANDQNWAQRANQVKATDDPVYRLWIWIQLIPMNRLKRSWFCVRNFFWVHKCVNFGKKRRKFANKNSSHPSGQHIVRFLGIFGPRRPLTMGKCCALSGEKKALQFMVSNEYRLSTATYLYDWIWLREIGKCHISFPRYKIHCAANCFADIINQSPFESCTKVIIMIIKAHKKCTRKNAMLDFRS